MFLRGCTSTGSGDGFCLRHRFPGMQQYVTGIQLSFVSVAANMSSQQPGFLKLEKHNFQLSGLL